MGATVGLSPEGKFGRELSRRQFLQLSGAAALMSSLGGCFVAPRDPALPYTRRPAEVVPGQANSYATAWEVQGYGVGLLATSREGRPLKIDGNPDHPASLGGSGPHEQALLMQLYDPRRPRYFLHQGAAMGWAEYRAAALARSTALSAQAGARLRLLVGPTASPLLSDLRDRILERFPRARIEAWDPLARDSVYDGTTMAFGDALEPLVSYRDLQVLVTLDADPLREGPSWLADARGLVEARAPGPSMLRLYSIEPTVSLTGMFADHRCPVPPSGVRRLAGGLLHELAFRHALPGLAFARTLPDPPTLSPTEARFVAAVAADLVRSRERALVLAGPRAPPEVHAIAWSIDAALGSLEGHVRFVHPPIRERRTGPKAVGALADEMRAGEVDTLIITAFDPVYSAPEGLAEALPRVPNVVYLAPHEDHTAALATWLVPRATVLESWGDTRAVDGTAGLVQPLIAPIFPSVTEAEALAPFAGLPDFDPYAHLRERWRSRQGGSEFETAWQSWLRRGVVPGTGEPTVRPSFDPARVTAALAHSAPGPSERIELHLRSSFSLHSGEFSYNPWALELPDPVTRQSWGNAALLSPATASRLGLQRGSGVRVAVGARSALLPVYVLPGQAENTVTIALGHGRGEDGGVNAYWLRSPDGFWSAPEAKVLPSQEPVRLVLMQAQDREDGLPIAITRDLDEFTRQGASLLSEQRGSVAKLYDPFSHPDEASPYRWAMAVDLQRCIGCASCVVACQAENNIPTVGIEDMARGRDMYWLRIDRYWQGPQGTPHAVTQPLACLHCEAAPCEYVCPVNATVHSDEGLNEMVYNRCVGTRYCSNNCPYKVRRFNFKGWHDDEPPLVSLAHNPEVTVRAQGVMEKCTYCVQRIERARIAARDAGHPIDTLSLETACMQACPTRAIVFGSLHQEDSPVARLHRDPRRYDLLHQLGTRPRTAYLARIRNPNPEL